MSIVYAIASAAVMLGTHRGTMFRSFGESSMLTLCSMMTLRIMLTLSSMLTLRFGALSCPAVVRFVCCGVATNPRVCRVITVTRRTAGMREMLFSTAVHCARALVAHNGATGVSGHNGVGEAVPFLHLSFSTTRPTITLADSNKDITLQAGILSEEVREADCFALCALHTALTDRGW